MDTYTYDQNGNQVTRLVDGVSWTLAYNAENRLANVSDGNGASEGYLYDGDGVRVARVRSGEATYLFMGGLYEVTLALPSGTVTGGRSYYTVEGQMLAMSDGSTTQYLLTDHLGSVVGETGNLLEERRYLPFGGERTLAGSSLTDLSFTGQRALIGTGLLDYHARQYDPSLRAFIQADSIIPNPYGVQDHNRYLYVHANPVRFTDPSGNMMTEGCGDLGLDSCGGTESEKAEAEYQRQRTEHNLCWAGINNYCSEFDKKVIKMDSLDFGNGTIQFGISANAFGGIGIRGDASVAIDGQLNFAVLTNGGGGGYSAVGLGVGQYISTSNAPNISYLEGYNVQVGAQVGEGETVAFEHVYFKGQNRKIYSGKSLSASTQLIGPWPGEFHGTATYSHILFNFNIIDIIIQPFRPDWIR